MPKKTTTKLTAHPDAFVRNEDQSRTFFDESKLQKIGDSLMVKQRQPVVVVPFTDPKRPQVRFKILDGERRWRGAKLKGLSELWYIIDDEVQTEEELHRASLTANFCREGHTHAELAAAIQRELSSGRSFQDVADMLGKSVTFVRDEHSLLKLHPDLMRLVDPPTPRRDKLAVTMAYELAKHEHTKQIALWKRFKSQPAKDAFHHLRTAGAGTGTTTRRQGSDARYILQRVRTAAGMMLGVQKLPPAMLAQLSDAQRTQLAEQLRTSAEECVKTADLITASLADNSSDDEGDES